jgi:hypothetical protein
MFVVRCQTKPWKEITRPPVKMHHWYAPIAATLVPEAKQRAVGGVLSSPPDRYNDAPRRGVNSKSITAMKRLTIVILNANREDQNWRLYRC